MEDQHETEFEVETKADAFKRLAVPRMNKILDSVRILGNLADKSRYEYTEEQIAIIEEALTEQVNKTIAKFRGKSKPDTFTL